ncbi:hypothetical protein IMSAGC019_03736 [Lachnospiraceae bacterium]|nr:hypothetical protein IMSAGC019_03736 [Lachnospiraceae bacterium]
MDENYVYNQIARISGAACERMNQFSAQILRTRGGRIGSGMGALLEALWGYMMNQIILDRNFPEEEKKQFTVSELRNAAVVLGIEVSGKNKNELYNSIRSVDAYQTVLRDL